MGKIIRWSRLNATEFKHIFWHNHAKNKAGCKVWVGNIRADGYGALLLNGKRVTVHRVAYKLKYGKIPANLCVLHKCDNRSCYNPRHLFLGTTKDNTHDAWVKQRLWNQRKKYCLKGHPLFGRNVYRCIRKKTGLPRRSCRACMREACAKWSKKQRLLTHK